MADIVIGGADDRIAIIVIFIEHCTLIVVVIRIGCCVCINQVSATHQREVHAKVAPIEGGHAVDVSDYCSKRASLSATVFRSKFPIGSHGHTVGF